MAKQTAIILVMFRQKHNLKLLYNSLHRQSYQDFRIYFVDNNPDDADRLVSEELNSKLGMDIEYIAAGGNTGFAGGNNLGAQKAISDGCQYIMFLNNDTELEESCLQELVNALGPASRRLQYRVLAGSTSSSALRVALRPAAEREWWLQSPSPRRHALHARAPAPTPSRPQRHSPAH
jgi:glycosyltransferase involved in cell wall biosynthesis